MPKLTAEYGLAVAAGLPWSTVINRISGTTSHAPTEANFLNEWAEMDADLGFGKLRSAPVRVVLDVEKTQGATNIDGTGGKFWITAGMDYSHPQVKACNDAVRALVKSFRANYPMAELSFWGGPLLELTPLCTEMLNSADFACHSIGSSWLHTWRDVRGMVQTYQTAYKNYNIPPSKILLCIQALNDDLKPRPGRWLYEAASAIRDGGHDLMLVWPPSHNRSIQYAADLVGSIRHIFD